MVDKATILLDRVVTSLTRQVILLGNQATLLGRLIRLDRQIILLHPHHRIQQPLLRPILHLAIGVGTAWATSLAFVEFSCGGSPIIVLRRHQIERSIDSDRGVYSVHAHGAHGI